MRCGYLVVVGSVLAVACPATLEKPAPAPNFGSTNGLLTCDTATAEANPGSRCFTSRTVAGVSMGGGTAGRIGFRHPELWDVVGIMGTPFADNEFLFRMLKDHHMGGFCSLEVLEQAMADGVDLDDSSNPAIFCGSHDVYPLDDSTDEQVKPGLFPAVEESQCSMFSSDFNHWYRGPEAGRGGSFSRNSLLEIMHDLVAANGNPFYANEESPYFPPGVPESWHVPARIENERELRDDLCAHPVVIQNFYNREYNPEGTYPVITFCDGNQRQSGDADAGDFFPDQRDRNYVVEFVLAVDLNGNGVRDYAEPVVINNEERFRDCGSDGLCPGAVGDTVVDNWDPLSNPTGTEGNFHLDPGESFDDDGVDGVPATGDFGEGNGDFDRAPALETLLADSPAALFNVLPDAQVNRLDVWMDAGVRDFLNTAQVSNALYSQFKRRIPATFAYNDFPDLPVDPKYIDGGTRYNYYMSDYSRKAMGQVAYLRYGDVAFCPGSDENEGAGNHVGAGDIVSRIFTLFSFLSARVPAQGRDDSYGGLVTDGAPNRNLNDFAFLAHYPSEVLGRSSDYGVLLPPDYFLSEGEGTEYPVLYFFHGQGMDAEGLVALGLALIGPMKESVRSDRIGAGKTDLQRAIIIWVDGECFEDDCFTGTFYADFKGLPRDDRRYESAFYELVKHVEATYRVLPPQLVPLDQIENQ